jgi:hypothetical protein
MRTRQRTTVEAVGEHHVRLQGVLERQADPIPVEAPDQQVAAARVCPCTRDDELLVDGCQPHAAPAQSQLAPGRDAVEVRHLLIARKRSQLGNGELDGWSTSPPIRSAGEAGTCGHRPANAGSPKRGKSLRAR